MITAREFLKKEGIAPESVRIAIQGMGKVGGVSAKLLFESGAKIIAVSDVSGGLYQEGGLNIPHILSYLSDKKSFLCEYQAEGISHITNAELLALDVDMLIPAALDNQITEANAELVRAKWIVEAANGPTTVAADEILARKGVTVVPDILANAGGVIVSYFEWVQNIQSLFWDENEVSKALNKIMCNAIEEVYKLHLEKGITLRTAAYAVALNKLVNAKKARGIFP
jgi:glutamate dehydrogenase/leucine dehydrogenase